MGRGEGYVGKAGAAMGRMHVERGDGRAGAGGGGVGSGGMERKPERGPEAGLTIPNLDIAEAVSEPESDIRTSPLRVKMMVFSVRSIMQPTTSPTARDAQTVHCPGASADPVKEER